ncbi:MAG: hydrolase [Bacteroidetes bacterium]|nr:hydrolase [Bacteroidota bacterium]
MRITKDNSIGLVIDMQSRLYPFINEHEQLTRNADILIRGMREIGLEIIITEQYTKGLGQTIEPLALALGDYEPIEKMAFSCCDEPSFYEALTIRNRKFAIITGIETHVCVLQTAIDLLDSGFIPVIVEDCVGSRRINDKSMAIQRMRQSGAIITTYESILFELLQYSGTDTFRAISKLVK